MHYKKALISLFTLLVVSSQLVGQTQPSETDTLQIKESFRLQIEDPLTAKFDSLVSEWLISARVTVDSSCTTRLSHCTPLPDSIYIERLQAITTVMEMPYNQEVKHFIELYTGRRRRLVERLLGLSQYYFPIIEQALDAEGLPHELKYLAVAESALNPAVVSPVGATGLWQFMLPTGKAYGLEVSTMVDERRDPIKSTAAAAKLLKDLYRIYGDWSLALAAYNCGAGNVNKAIRRAGGTRDYWAIYPHLPKGTREYLPLYISLNYIMHYHREHEICPSVSPVALDMDTVRVNQTIHFAQIADLLDVTVEELRAYNPQYRRDIIPGAQKEHHLRLPFDLMQAYLGAEDSIAIHRSGELLANHRITVNPIGVATSAPRGQLYVVRSGDNLGSIAKRHGVSVTRLKQMNNLTSDRLSIGQKLTVGNASETLDVTASNPSPSSDLKSEQYPLIPKG